MWLVNSLDDIRSDMSAYHRVDEVEHMTATRFVAYAYRLSVYGGAVSFVAKQNTSVRQEPQDVTPIQDRQITDVVELMKTDPLFMGQGTYVQVPAQ